MNDHHYLCNNPACPAETEYRAMYYRDHVGVATLAAPCIVTALGNMPSVRCHVLLRVVMIRESFCTRLEILIHSDGAWWVKGDDGQVWQEHQRYLLRSTLLYHTEPPIPEVELMFEKAGVPMDFRLAQYWDSPALPEIADARLTELTAHQCYIDLIRADLWRQRNERKAKPESAADVHQRKRQERQRREVDESGLPPGPPRGRSNILRKSKAAQQ